MFIPLSGAIIDAIGEVISILLVPRCSRAGSYGSRSHCINSGLCLQHLNMFSFNAQRLSAKDQTGQTMVEFAVIVPIVLLISLRSSSSASSFAIT